MACLLQRLIRSGNLVALLCAGMLGGCILSPPIEKYEEANYSPLIRPLPPNDRSAVINVTRESLEDGTTTKELQVKLYDPNEEPLLEYVFVSDLRFFYSSQALIPSGFERETENDPFFYGTVTLQLDVCADVANGESSETVTLYVSDRPFVSTGTNPEEITAVEDAQVDVYSWTFKYEPGLCS